jgi:hypothetical protein
MLDYIFFDPSLSGKFKDHLTKVGIEFECEDDKILDLFKVRLSLLLMRLVMRY